jgi:murein DD-endopeptidase MepM/ murein hydrolase activator NlpD
VGWGEDGSGIQKAFIAVPVILTTTTTAPAVNPTIAQTPMSGPPGTTFTQWGTGFTPNSTAILHFKKPDNTELPTQNQAIDSTGHFEITYTASADKAPGTYTWWAIDGPTKVKSNEVSYEITQLPVEKATLTIIIDPISGGKVTGTGIDCGTDCQESYNKNTSVQLTAIPKTGWDFVYWDDGTTNFYNNPKTVTMDKNKSITVKFINNNPGNVYNFVPPIHGNITHTDCPGGQSRYSMVWTGKYGGVDTDRCEGSGGHPGVDITRNRTITKESIFAIGKGTLIEKHLDITPGWGRYVVIRHDNVTYPNCNDCPKSVYSIYAHLNSIDPNLPEKDKTVESDQEIGIMGQTGMLGGVHLHLQIQPSWGGKPFWPKYTNRLGKPQSYPSSKGRGGWLDSFLTEKQRQEAAQNISNNTINPMWLIENGDYAE